VISVLFLDVDGVLNSHNYWTTLEGRRSAVVETEASLQEYAQGMIDPDAVAELNRIVKATGAVVVLSSSWRHAHSMTHMNRMLQFRGFEGFLVGATPELPHGVQTPAFKAFLQANPEHWTGRVNCRGNEIQAWLDSMAKVVSKFVILDDDSDFAHLEPFLVKTPHSTGLTPELADKAIEMLNGTNH
jgi:hypothetical protein